MKKVGSREAKALLVEALQLVSGRTRIKKQMAQDVEKLEPSHSVGENVK